MTIKNKFKIFKEAGIIFTSSNDKIIYLKEDRIWVTKQTLLKRLLSKL